MDAMIRVLAMYLFLMLVFRASGKRTLGESTPFDLVLLLVISETTQEALVDDDHSMTHSFLLILTFVGLNVLMSLWKQRSKPVEHLLEGKPVVIVVDGVPDKRRMDRERVDEDDVLEAARTQQGVERMDEIRFAILERSGTITVLPHERGG